MKEETKIEEKFGRDPGYIVPEGYFDSIYATISAKAAAMPAPKAPVAPSRWQRIRPFVYLAAMFAGIWCMMKVVTMVNVEYADSIGNVPVQIAQAMDNDEFYSDFKYSENIDNDPLSDYELETEMNQQYSDFSEFKKDFNNI